MLISEVSSYSTLRSEIRYGTEGSRIDFLLQVDPRFGCYTEVESVTLAEKERDYSPNTIAERGQKHPQELTSVAAKGKRTVIFFAVLYPTITRFSLARHIDARHARLLVEAQPKEVEILVYRAEFSAHGMTLKEPLPITL